MHTIPLSSTFFPVLVDLSYCSHQQTTDGRKDEKNNSQAFNYMFSG